MAWHPDGIHLISAGWDSKLHVWDLGASGDKRQKPKWTITTPAPVSCLAWRPGLWSATAQTRRVAQVAVSYDESSNKRYGASVVHIWDLARPTMPYKEIERFDSSPSALLWRDQDMLWTVGQDGFFNQCDVAYAPKSIDRLSTSAMAFSPRGDVVMFLDERAQQSRPRPIMHHSETPSRPTYSSSPNAYMLSGSKSDSEEDVLGTFIGPRRKLAHRRRLSGRSGQLLSTTPPSSNSFSDEDNSRESEVSEVSITEGYDFYDTEALSKAIDVPEPKTKEAADRRQSRIKPSRHDSEDSMAEMFSVSSGAKQRSLQSSSVEIAGTENHAAAYSLKNSSGSAETQFEPRIHGDTQVLKSKPTDSPEDVFMISQTTASTDDAYPSQLSFASQSDSDQNASFQQSTAPADPVASPVNSVSSPVASYYNDPRSYIIEADYLPWPDDPTFLNMKGDHTVPAALDPYLSLKRAFDFECRSSAVNAAAMVLLLRPLLPDDIIDTHLARGILRQHHQRLMRMSLFVEASSLRKLCIQGWPEGMPDWGENYTAIFGPAQQGVKTGLLCSSCRKPREVDPSSGRDSVWTCERCRAVMAPCAICNHRDAEVPSHIPGDDLDSEDTDSGQWVSNWWWFCPGCAHGGHASCLQIWHGAMEADDPNSQPTKFSGGCCPLDGCGHACLPGKYRGELVTARADELGRVALDSTRARDELRGGVGGSGAAGSRRSSPGGRDRSVRSDSYDIPQSKAVGMAREALNKGGSPSSGGILSSSPGRVPGTGERERRKSVKFVKTDR
ncbi:hypothetical protein V2A60_003114 [Cordyceps javanica]|nr:WD domain-containing protein [Cordyceps javanica]